MKVDLKNFKQNIKDIRKKKEPESISDAAVFSAPGVMQDADEGGFEVNVRNADVGIRLLNPAAAEGVWWRRELPHEMATSVALMSLPAFLLAAAYLQSAIPFALAGVAVYMGLVIPAEKFDVRIKYYISAVIVVLLVLSAIFLRRYIGGGLGTIMNLVYDASESTQAYIYNRHGVGAAEEAPDLCIRSAVVWISVLLGTLGALPGASVRRALGLMVAGVTMVAFAYYGIVPAALLAGIVIAAIMMVLARGGVLASLPVLLASLLLFGAVLAIGPGENYTISRIDENFRDRFALHSAHLETDLENKTPEEQQNELRQKEEEEENKEEDKEDELPEEKKKIGPILIAIAIILAIAAAAYLLYRRYMKKRDANRAGIDAEDLRTAIVAMFPYAVKWLGAADIDVHGKSFASLIEPLRNNISEQYSNYFRSMYVLWREAAYSNHAMDEEKRNAMKEFLNDTKALADGRMNKRARLRAKLKYAL